MLCSKILTSLERRWGFWSLSTRYRCANTLKLLTTRICRVILSVAATICQEMGPPQWCDLGCFLTNFMLLCREEGLHTCAQVTHCSLLIPATSLLQHIPLAGSMGDIPANCEKHNRNRRERGNKIQFANQRHFGRDLFVTQQLFVDFVLRRCSWVRQSWGESVYNRYNCSDKSIHQSSHTIISYSILAAGCCEYVTFQTKPFVNVGFFQRISWFVAVAGLLAGHFLSA